MSKHQEFCCGCIYDRFDNNNDVCYECEFVNNEPTNFADNITELKKITEEYKLSEEDIESVINKFNFVDMIDPISVEELSKAMLKVSEDVKFANLSFEELVEYIAKVQEATRR